MFESDGGRAVIRSSLICFFISFINFPPIGLIMENGTCISVSNCPCIYHGTAFPVGSKIEQECSNWYVKASLSVFPLSVTTAHS